MRISNRQAIDYIARRAEFTSNTGSLRGEAHTPGHYVFADRLDGRTYPEDSQPTDADYIVFSYATPIGWHIPGKGWIEPDARYSVTTSRHQGALRQGIRAAA